MELNEVGDLVVAKPEELRAIADPHRLDLIDRLRRGGAAEAGDLPHLEELERLGFVTRDGDRWSAVGKGIYFEIPDDDAGQQAARELTRVMLLREADRPRRWADVDEPRLDAAWARASGMFNARVQLTAAELNTIQQELETLLAPYTKREDAPDASASVRVLAYFLPEPLG